MKQKGIWILPLAVAATIIWLSHQPSLPMAVSLPPPLDKLAHFVAFGVLAASMELAMRSTYHDLPVYRRHLLVFLCVAIFGAMDEWHQYFVPGRAHEFLDWVADSAGAVFCLGLMSLPFFWSRRLVSFGWWRGSRERPDPSRPLILVADAHWCEELTGLREATNAHPEADWLFLGDVFDVWVGVPGMQTEAQRSFLWWVEERRAAGRWVGLWMGNREYFLDSLGPRFSLLGEGIEGSLPSENLAWEHGDLLNTRDHQYRFWCLISRSGFVWLLVRMLPGRMASVLAARLERGMRTTNRAYKLAFPREAFQAAAAHHDQALFLTGHFHTYEVEGNGISLPWAHEGAFMVWQHGRVEPLR